MISSDLFFTARQEQLAALALRHAVPAVYESREFTAAGGLMSYGGSTGDSYRLAGAYTGVFSMARSLASCRYSSLRKSRCS